MKLNNIGSPHLHSVRDFTLELIAVGLVGFKASLSIIKVMVPISLAVIILKYFGVVDSVSKAVAPFFSYLGLPGEAILALISGYIINCYSALAVIATLSLTGKELTILSVMLLLCHTLPIELGVQKKAGGPFWLIMALRIGSSLVMGLILNQLIPNEPRVLMMKPMMRPVNHSGSFLALLISWLLENVVILKIIAVNIIVIIFYSLLKRFNVVSKLSNFFKPFMVLLGLPKESAFLWIVTNVLGLIFGATMLIEAKNSQKLDEINLKKLNISLATCHALVGETANFYAIGAWLPFLILPRIMVSILAVWGYSLFEFRVKKSRQNAAKV